MQSGPWQRASPHGQHANMVQHGQGHSHITSCVGRPPTPTRQHNGSLSPVGGVQGVRTASPGPRGPLVWPQAAAWQQSNGGHLNHRPRHSSPSPGARAIPRMDSVLLHRQGYSSPAHRQSPQPGSRSSSPATGPSHHHIAARGGAPVDMQAVPNRQLFAHKPVARAVPMPTEPASSLRSPDVSLNRISLPQDQVSYYKGQVQDLKHAIQAHASSMGLQVSAIMDRSVTENNLASDNLLLQVWLLPMPGHLGSLGACTAPHNQDWTSKAYEVPF